MTKDCQAKTTAGGGQNLDAVHFGGGAGFWGSIAENIYVAESDRYGVYVDSDQSDVRVTDCILQTANVDDEDMFIDGTNVTVSYNVFRGGGTIILGSNSSGCVVDGNTNVTVTDNGVSNVVGDNT